MVGVGCTWTAFGVSWRIVFLLTHNIIRHCIGMSAGLPDFVTVNLSDLKAFSENDTVTLSALQKRNVLNISGRDAKLPLKVSTACWLS